MIDILTQNGYKWPGLYKPFEHQKITADFLVRNKRCFCFNGIGSGKTLSALWAADFLMQHSIIKKVLIVAPLSTLHSVWADEIFKNSVHRTYSVLYGSKEKRRQMLEKNTDFYIINFDGVESIIDDLMKKSDIDLVIADEGAILRNARTNRWKSMNRLAGPHTNKAIWWMTGAPIPNGPEGTWAQAKLVNPDSGIHRYFTRFRDELMVKKGLYNWIPINGWEQRCYNFLQPSIRYKTSECIDLPPYTIQRRVSEMGKHQQKAYDQMKKEFVAELKDGEITAVNEGVKCLKLVQIAAGAVYSGDAVHFLDPIPKLNILKQVIRESDNKAIVFVPFRHSIKLLKKFMETLNLSIGVVYGDVYIRTRREIFNDFQNGDLNIILAHPGTMAHGLTLTAAHTIIWWSPVDNYEIDEQANGRIRRPGQKSPQTIVQLSCSEIENKIYARLRNKEKMQGLLLELLSEK